MDELKDLINRFEHLQLSAKADQPNSAIAILSKREIELILEKLRLDVTSRLIHKAPG